MGLPFENLHAADIHSLNGILRTLRGACSMLEDFISILNHVITQ